MTPSDQETRERAVDDANQASRDSTDHPEASTHVALDEDALRASGDEDEEPAGEDEPPPATRDD